MGIIKRMVGGFSSPQKIGKILLERTSFLWKDDRKYLQALFYLRFGYKPNWDEPCTYNEKLNWLKMYDHNPLYTKLVDKYSVKGYVSSVIGEKYIIPTIGVWDNPDDIDWDVLPNQFVLKTTHGGGNSGVVLCKDKNSINKERIISKLKVALSLDIYKQSREWPYKDVPRRILAEPYIEDEETKELRDYKFFCFNGKVEFLFVGSERQKPGEGVKFDFFDKDYNHLDIRQGHPNSKILPSKPYCFEEMKTVASVLSKGLPHVRVDLYEANRHVYFGEMTFYHFGGLVPFEPESWDKVFGDMLQLPIIKHN